MSAPLEVRREEPARKERGILFSAPMVLKLPSGEKTQTRRMVKQPGLMLDGAGHPFTLRWDGEEQINWRRDVSCPHGVPGDLLWVRETWGYRGNSWTNKRPEERLYTIEYQADGASQEFRFGMDEPPCLPKQKPAGPIPDGADEFEARMERSEYLTRYWRQWRPSIHMPKWAARIWLEITGVRVERLQDISEEDAKAEGVHQFPDTGRWKDYVPERGAPLLSHATARDSFFSLWEAINGTASLAANPWVWALTFRRVESPSLSVHQEGTP
jgi:hypothetical protein